MNTIPKDEIKNLLKRINVGDFEAFDRLTYLKSKYLKEIANRYVRDEMLAEDIVSEVFYQLVKKCDQFKNDKNLNGWLNVVVVNKAINVCKKRNKEILVYEMPHYDTGPNRFEEQIHIRECLIKLDDNERQAILFQHHGYTLKEISKMMNLTRQELLWLLEKAKKKFKNFYEN